MRHLFSFLFTLTALFFISCGGSEYSEEEQQTLVEAQTAHNQAMDEFSDALDKLNVITSLQDSMSLRIDNAQRMAEAEGTNTDSLREVGTAISMARDELTAAKNALLNWGDNIYGLPESESVYSGDNPNEAPSIAKDEFNDMLENNITYKELPPDITPAELLAIQQDQLTDIQAIHKRIQAAINNAEETIAENL